MGEGRRDRSSRRHRANLGIEKSSSDTEIGRSNGKSRKNRSKKKKHQRWPFLEGLTVDELGRYRRRRVENHPKDTLGAYSSADLNQDEALVTEYRRAFRAISEDSIVKNIIASPVKKLNPESANKEEIVETLVVVDQTQQTTEQNSPTNDRETTMESNLEKSVNYDGNCLVATRPPLMRRGTSLKREGDEFYGNTEYSNYVTHEGNHRAELARRPTSLKMEGNMAGRRSEQCEKFIEWLNVTRPELARIPTNLKLEGDIESTSENHDKYVPFVGARRPQLLRQTAHLKLEGESYFLPEYAAVFRDHHLHEKRTPLFPESHLKSGGDFYEKTESMAYGDPTNMERNEEARDDEDELTKERERRKEQQDMKMLVSKMEDMKGPAPLQVPEYKDAYKDFPRERPKLMKPEDEIGRADGSKINSSSPSQSKFPMKIDRDLEYRSKFLDQDRGINRKPPISLRGPSVGTTSALEGRTSRDYRRHEEATSEVRSQYISYGQIPRVESVKMPANLRLEGNIDLQPEYRDAYCTRRENNRFGISEPRAHRHRDRSLSASRRRDSCWINNNNSEHFGQINAANDQDAFQLLTTKVHEDSVVGKPPPASRRAAQLDTTSQSALLSMRNRSPSPSYRLRVNNVDDNDSRGFARRSRRSPSFQVGDHAQSPSPAFPHHPPPHHHQQHQHHHDHHEDSPQRAYSPSFGTNQHRNAERDDHAFVVLDNAATNHNAPFNPTIIGNRSRKLIDRNGNNSVIKSPRLGRPRNRTPTNWMPPWYDNTNTI